MDVAKRTMYGELLNAAKRLLDTERDRLIQESTELTRIFAAILRNSE